MNLNYHIDKLESSFNKKSKWKGNPIIGRLMNEYRNLGITQAMEDYISTGDLLTYVKKINKYDFIIYQYAKESQASNPVSTRQTKILSTWRENIWTPIWERLRSILQTRTNLKLVTIQNDKVIQSFYSTGEYKFKDVDGGIGYIPSDSLFSLIKGKRLIEPLLSVEDKGGHACSTAMDGIQGQGLQFSLSYPNSLFFFITDNNFSVKDDKSTALYQNVDGIICSRGKNRKNLKGYDPVDENRIDAVIKKVESYFTKKMISLCVKNRRPIQVKGQSQSIRNVLDQKGSYFNF